MFVSTCWGQFVVVMPSMPSSIEGEAIAVVVALVQIMPDLQEICASPSLPLSVEHVKVDSLVTLCSREPSDMISAPIPPTSALSPELCSQKIFVTCSASWRLLLRGVEGRLLAS
jgi:hypothetical protein